MRKRLLLIPLENLMNLEVIDQLVVATKSITPDFAFIMLSLEDEILALSQKQVIQRLLEDSPADHGRQCIYFGSKGKKGNNRNLTIEDSYFFLTNKEIEDQAKTIVSKFEKNISEDKETTIVFVATPALLQSVTEKLDATYKNLDFSYAEDIEELLMQPVSKKN